MGQKVNPVSLRLGVNRSWDSRWYAEGPIYASLLHQDLKIRKHLAEVFKQADVARVVIERPHGKCQVTIHTARPGVVIGKKGADIEKVRKDLRKIAKSEVQVNIAEIRKPEAEALLVAENIAFQISNRAPFRRTMKRALSQALRQGVEGIRICCSGRLGGAEIARTEWYREGRVPLHTLRADVDYASVPAHTTYGVCGVKVWIFRGEIMEKDSGARDRKQEQPADGTRPPASADGKAGEETAATTPEAAPAEAKPAEPEAASAEPSGDAEK